MGAGLNSELERTSPSRAGGARKVAIVVKLLVTGACFWYISRQIDLSEVLSSIALLDFRWAALAIFLLMLQLPLLGLRWRNIVDALAAGNERMTRAAIIVVAAIGAFFSQVLPSVAGEGVRAWFLVRLGSDWRNAVTSVVIDRAVGVGLLIVLGFVVLLLPSGLGALGGYRDVMLGVYCALLLLGAFGLLFAPKIVPRLAQWRYSRWLATLTAAVHRVLLGSSGPMIVGIGCLIHALTILVIWSLGRAQGILLPIPDAAVLMTIMIGVALVPISIGGWGLRELAIISLLGHHGMAPEKALLFSVSFGLAVAIGSLPGALAWLLYSFAPSRG
jgi:glycosyltransferase 2 family protein